MRNKCNIIRDLLPLYVEHMVSSDTADFVTEHLNNCDACKIEYEKIKEPQPSQDISDAAPLLKLSEKLKAKRIQTIALTAVFVIAVLVSAFAILGAPIYLPYSDNLITLTQSSDQTILITFAETVTDYRYTVYKDPDGNDCYYCEIEAWTCLWDKWFSKRNGNLSQAVKTMQTNPIIVVYVPSDGTENICIAKYNPNDKNQIHNTVEYLNTIILPRLSLGYYLLLAVAVLVVCGIVWFGARKNAILRIWIERIGLYPVAYIISHCIVSGINLTSYSLPRDISLIIFISILFYSGLLLAHNIWYVRKEIKEITDIHS